MIANLFGLSKWDLQNQLLSGHIAIEVDYRVVTTRKTVGSHPTKAGPRPRIVAAPTLLKGVAPIGGLPTLRADVKDASMQR